MASVEDRWYVDRKQADDTVVRERTARYGTGMRWMVRWRDENDTERKKSFERKADAESEASRIVTELARGTYIDPRAGEITFQAYAERWLATQFDDPSTTYQVGLRLRLHIFPVLGRRPLQAITPTDIRAWVHGLRIARSYQSSLFANVSQIFTAAIADDIIAKNPCRSRTVRKPVPDPRRIVPWSTPWVAGVCAALPDRYAVLGLLAAGTGMRQGEIFGLSPDDLDVERGHIAVNRQIKLTPGNTPYFALPKGRKIRTVPMPDTVRDALTTYQERFPARTVALPWDRPDGAPTPVALLLTSRERKPVNRHYFNAKIWKPALVATGIPPIRENGCHALRHYYASVLLDGGESIRTVSERLGHADPAFTLRIYTHLMPDNESRTRSIIDTALQTFPAAQQKHSRNAPGRPPAGSPTAPTHTPRTTRPSAPQQSP